MRKNLLFSIVIIFVIFVSESKIIAQSKIKSSSVLIERYSDSIANVRKNVFSDVERENTFTPELYKLLSPSVYYRSPLIKYLSLDSVTCANYDEASTLDVLLLNMYRTSPNLLEMHEDTLSKEDLIMSETLPVEKGKHDISDIFNTQISAPEKDIELVEDVKIEVTRPNFWKTSCTFSSQFTQNYFSDNWYKGGNNNATMLTSLIIKAAYDDQKMITWENTLDMRLGLITTTDDSCHNFLTNNDRIRLWTKLGVKASNSWSYTTILEATTQFLPSYRSNDRQTYSDFLAPLDVILSIGMDYKPKFKNKNMLSVALLPLSYKLRYVGVNDEVILSATSMDGKKTREDFGSKMEIQSSVNILKNLTWDCRFVAFTSYEYVESELENRLRFKLTKYISSELNTLWRFDDNRPRKFRDDDLGYFQFREYLTFGITYDF